MHDVITRTLTLAALVGAALFGTSAQAGWNGSGSQMRAAFANEAACVQANMGYGGIINTCPWPVWVKAALPVTQGYWNTQVRIYGSSTQCVITSTDLNGESAVFFTQNYTLSGPQRWQTVNTGILGVWDWTPVVFACNLEVGGRIGSFAAY